MSDPLSFLHHPGESPEQNAERLLAEGEAKQEVENDDKASPLNAGVLGRMLPVPAGNRLTTEHHPRKAVAEMSDRHQHSEDSATALAWRYHGSQGPWNMWLARHDLLPAGCLAPHLGRILS